MVVVAMDTVVFVTLGVAVAAGAWAGWTVVGWFGATQAVAGTRAQREADFAARVEGAARALRDAREDYIRLRAAQPPGGVRLADAAEQATTTLLDQLQTTPPEGVAALSTALEKFSDVASDVNVTTPVDPAEKVIESVYEVVLAGGPWDLQSPAAPWVAVGLVGVIMVVVSMVGWCLSRPAGTPSTPPAVDLPTPPPTPPTPPAVDLPTPPAVDLSTSSLLRAPCPDDLEALLDGVAQYLPSWVVFSARAALALYRFWRSL